jgi:hypothetical protein
MAEGFLGGLLGGIGDAAQGVGSGLAGLLGGGQSGGPSSSGFTPDEERRMLISTLGQLGSTLLAAGQKQSPSQRAQYLAQLGGIGSGAQNDIYKARQGALMSAQMQEKMREMEQSKALSTWASNPENLSKLGVSPEQFSVLGVPGLRAIMQAQAARDPNQMALTQATLAGKQREVEQYNAAVSAIEGANLSPEQRAAALSNPGEWIKTQIKPGKMFVDEPVLNQAGQPVIDPATNIPMMQQRNLQTGEIKRIGGGGVNIDMGGGKALEQGIAKSLIEGADVAQSAASAIRNIGVARQQFEGGIISGITAPLELTIRKIGTALGFTDNQVSNTEAFRSSLAPVVLESIKGLGAGTAISNADREYAEKFVGGNITLDNASIAKIIGIVEKANSYKVESHNTRVKKYMQKAKDPSSAEFLLVETPEAQEAQPSRPQGEPRVRRYNPATGKLED